METSGNKQATEQPTAPFAFAICRVAVAQICQSIGFRGAQPSALRALSDVAARYLQALARSASAIANAQGRTDSNVSDLALAIEKLSSPRGFAGAYDVRGPPLRSGALKEIVDFVRSVEEIPFAKPIRREKRLAAPRVSPPSFEQLRRDPPLSCVPRWLPGFPDSWERRKKGEGIRGKGGEYNGCAEEPEDLRPPGDGGVMKYVRRAALPGKRARVEFKLRLGLQKMGPDLGLGFSKGEKRVVRLDFPSPEGSTEEDPRRRREVR